MDANKLGQFLRDLQADDPQMVHNLAVFTLEGQVIASTDPDPARAERLARLLGLFAQKAHEFVALYAREPLELICIRLSPAALQSSEISGTCLILRPLVASYILVIDFKWKSSFRDPALWERPSTHAQLSEMLMEIEQ